MTDNSQLKNYSMGYYNVEVINPSTEGRDPYVAECNDLIEALGLTYAEGNILKALFRVARARQGAGKEGLDPVYDLEKLVYFANRLLIQAKPGEPGPFEFKDGPDEETEEVSGAEDLLKRLKEAQDKHKYPSPRDPTPPWPGIEPPNWYSPTPPWSDWYSRSLLDGIKKP